MSIQTFSVMSYWSHQPHGPTILEAGNPAQAVRLMAQQEGVNLKHWKIVKVNPGEPRTYKACAKQGARRHTWHFRAIRKET